MTTPIDNLTYNANTTRTAVLMPNTRRRRTTTDWLKMLAELDEASVNREFDRESRHTDERDFAPFGELMNDDKIELIISDPPKPKGIEALLAELSEVAISEPNSDYASYEIVA